MFCRTIVSAVAGAPTQLIASVGDSAKYPVVGTRVVWRLPAGWGTDSVIAITDSRGLSTASVTAPTVSGGYHLVAQAGAVSCINDFLIREGEAVRVNLGGDSVRITRMNGYRRISLRAYDVFDNRVPFFERTATPASGLTVTVTGPFVADFLPDSLNVAGNGSDKVGTGDVLFTGRTGNVLARVKVNLQPVAASVALAGGLDSVGGVAVGQVDTLQVTVRDSGGAIIPGADLAGLGVRFSSSDPSVATVSTGGLVTGVRVGAVRISMEYLSRTYSVPIPVVAAYDFGLLHKISVPILNNSRDYAMPALFDSSGGSVSIVRHSATFGGTISLALYDPDGARRWSLTTEEGNSPVAFGASESVYIVGSTRIHVVDASGKEQWSRPTSEFDQRLFRFASGVLLVSNSTIRAFASDGTLLWTRADAGGYVWDILTSSDRIFVRKDSVAQSLTLQGALVWSRPEAYHRGGGATDASSVWYLPTAGGTSAVAPSGALLWTAPFPPADAFNRSFAIASPSVLVVQDYTTLMGIDRNTGATLWSTFPNAPLKVVASNGRVFTFGVYVYVRDALTGKLLGRSATRTEQIDMALCTPAGLLMQSNVTYAVWRYDHC